MTRIVRFGVVGMINTGVYYGFYLILRSVAPYLLAHVMAFLLAMVGSYFLNCWFTFHTRPTLRKFLLFPLSNAANFTITSLGLYLLVDIGHFDEKISPLIAAAAAIPVTYLVARYVLVDQEKRVAS